MWWSIAAAAADDGWPTACAEALGDPGVEGSADPSGDGWTIRCGGHSWTVDDVPDSLQARIELLWVLLAAARPTATSPLTLPPPPPPLALPPPPPRPVPGPPPVAVPEPIVVPPVPPPVEAPTVPTEAAALGTPTASLGVSDVRRVDPGLELGLVGGSSVAPGIGQQQLSLEARVPWAVVRVGVGRSIPPGSDGGFSFTAFEAGGGIAATWRVLRVQATVTASRRIAHGWTERYAAWVGVLSGDLMVTVPENGLFGLTVGARGAWDTRETVVYTDRARTVPLGSLAVTTGVVLRPLSRP